LRTDDEYRSGIEVQATDDKIDVLGKKKGNVYNVNKSLGGGGGGVKPLPERVSSISPKRGSANSADSLFINRRYIIRYLIRTALISQLFFWTVF
jgi:hypothetical protein